MSSMRADAPGVWSDPAPHRDQPDGLAGFIEGEIIPRLLLAHRAPCAFKAPLGEVPIRFDEEGFLQALLEPEFDASLEHLARLVRSGASVPKLLLELLAPTARRLGDMWSDDRCSFADVTLALARLQQLVRELGSVMPLRATARPGDAPRVMLAPLPGEQHVLGLVMLEETFRAAGWIVWLETGANQRALVQLVSRAGFDVIGLTAASEGFLDRAPQLIAALRKASRNQNVRVMLGGAAFQADARLPLRLGADATAADAQSALSRAEELVAHAAFA